MRSEKNIELDLIKNEVKRFLPINNTLEWS